MDKHEFIDFLERTIYTMESTSNEYTAFAIIDNNPLTKIHLGISDENVGILIDNCDEHKTYSFNEFIRKYNDKTLLEFCL